MCTGSQMWHLFNMIPLLLCEFSLDDSELYECFLLLQEITTIVFSLLLCIEQIEYLEFCIGVSRRKCLEGQRGGKPLLNKYSVQRACTSPGQL